MKDMRRRSRIQPSRNWRPHARTFGQNIAPPAAAEMTELADKHDEQVKQAERWIET